MKESVLLSYAVGDRLRLLKDGCNEIVDVLSIKTDPETNLESYKVIMNNGNEVQVPQEFLADLSDSDVGQIPVTIDQVKEHLPKLTKDELEALVCPVEKDPLVSEFMAWHDRSGHLPIPDMFRLAEEGLAPSKFLKLKDKKLICPSCLFGKAHKRRWRTSRAHGSLSSEDDTPGSRTSIDHVISAQPGLVPRIDGRHTRQRIAAGCVFVDHASRLSYTHLQTSVDNEQTIDDKIAIGWTVAGYASMPRRISSWIIAWFFSDP